MIDLENVKKEFDKYVNQYDMENVSIKLKYEHTLRVAKNCEILAQYLNLNQEETKLAILIGYLHDIGRFEQATKYNTLSDVKSAMDHAEYGIEELFERNKIRNFIQTNEYDEIIKTAVKYHNKIEYKEGISEKMQLFCKLIKDADKIDIFRVAIEKDPELFFGEKYVENEEMGKEVAEEFYNNKLVNKKYVKNAIEKFAVLLALVYDINYKKSFQIIKNDNLIEKVTEKFIKGFEVKDTKQIEKMQEHVQNYLSNINIM